MISGVLLDLAGVIYEGEKKASPASPTTTDKPTCSIARLC